MVDILGAEAWAEAVAAQRLSAVSAVRNEDPVLSVGRREAGTGADAFVAAFTAAGGPAWLADHFVADVLPCEGSVWAGYHGPYWTRAQFSDDTWAKIIHHFDYWDPDDPAFVGRAVWWWITQIGIENYNTTSGWPVCGNR